MAKYRKKPVVVDAWQLPISDETSREFDGIDGIVFDRKNGAIVGAVITTLEGMMTASNGDWIIRGVTQDLA